MDEDIEIEGSKSEDYPKNIRMVTFYHKEAKKIMRFITNNFEMTAEEIADLYKSRWQIELFFKWIKQHLKIKSFWGESPNAVKTQIWIAISVYVIVLIIKKKLKLEQSTYEILQILSVNIFDKDPINQLFTKSDLQNFKEQNYNQLKLFDL